MTMLNRALVTAAEAPIPARGRADERLTPTVAATSMRVRKVSDESHKKPESDRIYERKQRCCLRCQKAFTSTWPGERVCQPCKSSSDWRDAICI